MLSKWKIILSCKIHKWLYIDYADLYRLVGNNKHIRNANAVIERLALTRVIKLLTIIFMCACGV